MENLYMFVLGIVTVIFILINIGVVYAIFKIVEMNKYIQDLERNLFNQSDYFRNEIENNTRNVNQEINELYRKIDIDLKNLHDVINSEVDSRIDKLIDKLKKNELGRS